MVHGAALAFSNTSTATIATASEPRSRFAEGMGIFGLATALATAVAPAIGLALMEKCGFFVLFLFGSLSIALALVLFFLLKAPNIAVEKKPLSLKGLFDKNAVPASLTAVVFMFTYGALENFAAKFAAEKGLPSGGLFFVIMAVTVLIMRMTAG